MQPALDPINLRKAREALGITRVEASRRMNIPQSSYVRYEQGTRKPTQATIAQMAQVLGTNTDYLTGLSDDPRADILIIKKDNSTILFEMAMGMQDFDEEQLKKLHEYYKIISKEK